MPKKFRIPSVGLLWSPSYQSRHELVDMNKYFDRQNENRLQCDVGSDFFFSLISIYQQGFCGVAIFEKADGGSIIGVVILALKIIMNKVYCGLPQYFRKSHEIDF